MSVAALAALGVLGAFVTRAVLFVEAANRVKGWPWAYPFGCGGGVWIVTQCLHLIVGGISAPVIATAVTPADYESLLAFCVGAGAPAVVKKLGQMAFKLGAAGG